MAITNFEITVFENYSGSVTINSASAGTLNTLPDEAGGSGLALNMTTGDTITFNNYQSTQTKVSDNNDNFSESDPSAVLQQATFGQPAGTQINGGYEFNLIDNATGLTYSGIAFSFGENNDDLDASSFAMDATDGWMFYGPNGAPPEGVELEVTSITGIVDYPWADTFVICFADGTFIDTKNGPVLVEDLQVGDMVTTLDNGAQPVKHIYKRTVLARGSMTPVRFEAGTIGNTHPVRVSQKHRMLTSCVSGIKGRRLPEDKLIWASELCDGSSIRLDQSKEYVTYYHLMFERHELVNSSGAWSESWQPTRKNLSRHPYMAKELLEIFPEIRHMNGNNAGRLVRPEVTINPERMAKS